MKKTQVALAALALVASTAAMAEVTIYGTLEGAVANSTTKGSYFSGAGAWVAGNNIGFKGSEDIGGGLKASFDLQAGVDLNGYSNNGGAATPNTTAAAPSTAATQMTNALFSRRAIVGLSGEFGSLNLGQDLSPFVLSHAANGTLGNGHFFVNRLVIGNGVAGGGNGFYYEGFWVPNAITYTAPSIAGWTLTGMVTTKTGNTRGTVPDAQRGDSYQAYSATGNVAGVNVSVAYETRAKDTDNAVAGWGTSAINANYTVGDFHLAGSYMSTKSNGSDKVGSYSVEGGYDLTPNTMISLQYAANDKDTKQSLYAVSLKQTLSKRTFVYLTYLNAENTSSNFDTRGGGLGANNHTTAVGVAHSF